MCKYITFAGHQLKIGSHFLKDTLYPLKPLSTKLIDGGIEHDILGTHPGRLKVRKIYYNCLRSNPNLLSILLVITRKDDHKLTEQLHLLRKKSR